MAVRDHLEVDERFDLKWHHFIDVGTWDFCYERGYREPRYPVPAIRYSEELVHWNDDVHFMLMFPDMLKHCWRIVGDSKEKPLVM